MLISEHSALGALAAAALTYAWNRREPNQNLSVLWLTVLGAIAARLPDWDIDIVEIFGFEGTNWAHRSVYTHSLLGIILFSNLVILVLIAISSLGKQLKWDKKIPIEVVTFILSIAFLTHLVSDVLEAYPTRILYPISNYEFTGWIPSSVYYSNIFLYSSWIIGYGGSVALIQADKKQNTIHENSILDTENANAFEVEE